MKSSFALILLVIPWALNAESLFVKAIFPVALIQKHNAKPNSWDSSDVPTITLEPITAADRSALFERFSIDDGLKPEVVRRYAPIYPFAQKEQGVTGSALVYLIVSKEGVVSDVYVTDFTHVNFAVAAAHGLFYWQFKPSHREQLVAIPVPFSLK